MNKYYGTLFTAGVSMAYIGLGLIIAYYVLIFLRWLMGFWLDEVINRACAFLVDSAYTIIDTVFKHIICVYAPIRGGKSIFCSAIMPLLVVKVILKLKRNVIRFRRYNYKIDFNVLDMHIRDLRSHGRTIYQTADILLSKEGYRGHNYRELFNLTYSDGPKICSMIDFFRDYVAAYYRWLDGNYICSNIDYVDPITGKKALPIPSSALDIKLMLEKEKLFPFEQYQVIFVDDYLAGGKLSGQFQTIAQEDGGTSLLERLIGNMMAETTYLLLNVQKVFRIVKEEREMINTVVKIQGHTDVGRFNSKRKWLVFLDWIQERKLNRLDEIDIKTYASPKKMQFNYDQKLNALENREYKRFQILVSNDIDDLESGNQDYEAYNLCLPKNYAYRIDTHFYKKLLQYLRRTTEKNYRDLAFKERLSDEECGSMIEREPTKKEREKKAKKEREEAEKKEVKK